MAGATTASKIGARVFERFKIWWYFKWLRMSINYYRHLLEEEEEWTHRFLADDEASKRKQLYHQLKIRGEIEGVVRSLLYDDNLPRNRWIDLGDGREFRLPESAFSDRIEIRQKEGEQ